MMKTNRKPSPRQLQAAHLVAGTRVANPSYQGVELTLSAPQSMQAGIYYQPHCQVLKDGKPFHSNWYNLTNLRAVGYRLAPEASAGV